MAAGVDVGENQDHWSDDQGVDGDESDDKVVPDSTESSLSVDEVPLNLLLVVEGVNVIIFVVLDVIDHHFSQVLISHLLKSCLESHLVAETLGLTPKVLDSSLLLVLGHVVPLVLVAVPVVLSANQESSEEASDLLSAVADAVVVGGGAELGHFEFSLGCSTFERLVTWRLEWVEVVYPSLRLGWWVQEVLFLPELIVCLFLHLIKLSFHF